MTHESYGHYFVYYCSGHGYGHATRVSAFACHLLALKPRQTVHIVSSAPKHVFADSVALGALYRYADIDPVIVQPLAPPEERECAKSISNEEGAQGSRRVTVAQGYRCRLCLERRSVSRMVIRPSLYPLTVSESLRQPSRDPRPPALCLDHKLYL